eukprot:EG_transcript_60185
MATTLFDYFQAIRASNEGEVKAVLASGQWPVNFQNGYGQTAVHIATIHNKPDIIGLLARYNANLDLQDIQGHTPLHIACRNAHHGADYLPTIRLLLQLGAAPDIPSNP